MTEPEEDRYMRLVDSLRLIPAITSRRLPHAQRALLSYDKPLKALRERCPYLQRFIVRMPVRQQQYLRDEGALDEIFALVLSTRHRDFKLTDLVTNALPGYIDAWASKTVGP
jgi:hypothetical protein